MKSIFSNITLLEIWNIMNARENKDSLNQTLRIQKKTQATIPNLLL
jgi:hypothetical protein